MSLLRPDEQQQLTGLLLQLPNIDDPAERQALIECLPQGLQNSIPHSDQATVHIASIVATTGADAWNPLPDGTWAILLLIDTAASLVEGSTLATDLKALRDTLQAGAAALPPRPAAETAAATIPAVAAAAPAPAATPRSLLLSPPRVYFLGASVVAVLLCVGLGIIGMFVPPPVSATPTAIFTLAPPSTPTVSTREYHWEHYDTDLTVNKDGSFDVVDTQVVSFTKGVFATGYRSVPVQGSTQVRDYQVTQITDQGERIPFTLYTGSYDLQAGRIPPARTFVTFPDGAAFRVYWVTDPLAAPARLTVEVRYHVQQALQLDPAGDQFVWKNVPTARTALIDHSRVRVQLPADVPMADVRALVHPEGIAAIGINGSTVTFDSAREIQPNETIEVQVQWPHGVVGVP